MFPDHKDFVTGMVKAEDLPASWFPFGPYPKDALTYKSKTVVEYRTPAQADGLGTVSWLKKNNSPIEGVAILVGETPDLVFLHVRLPAALTGLASVIIHQVEADAEHEGGN